MQLPFYVADIVVADNEHSAIERSMLEAAQLSCCS